MSQSGSMNLENIVLGKISQSQIFKEFVLLLGGGT